MPASARPARVAGYAAIRDYAAVGDGRTIALVARDGSIDWLCLPELDSPSVFGAVLDPGGGRFSLEPELPYAVTRGYVPDTNVLETTFSTDEGVVRVTDAMLLPLGGLAPGRELARRIEGLSGSVALRWRVEPRFGYGMWRTSIERRGEVPVAVSRESALAVCSWGAGEPECHTGSIAGRFRAEAGSQALIALGAAEGEALVFSPRSEVEARLDATVEFWRGWAAARTYDGPWRSHVLRSALALKLLIYAPSGAIAAAATVSLPETMGGERNWDYRFSWVRDASFTLDALMRLGCPREAEAFFWWLLHASQLTHPELRVLYRLDGGAETRERTLPFVGYRSSSPVRVGNAAVAQRQLDIYGHVLDTAWTYAREGGRLDGEAARRLAATADHVAAIWRERDSGIWEVRSAPAHFTESKMMCWVALDRAVRLAERGMLAGGRAARWRTEADAVRRFVEEHCWSDERSSYVRSAGTDELDASLLLGSLFGYRSGDDPRLNATIDRLRHELGAGPLLYRYRGEDGLRGQEGAFLACSFWLVDALARAGRIDEAGETMEDLLGLANEVGLYAEEIDPDTGAFLGNFPQGLVHLALLNAAVTLREAGVR